MYRLLNNINNAIYMNKTNHPISSNSHPLATANKAIHSLKRGRGVKKQREHRIILTKYEAVHPTDVSENNSSSGMLILLIINRTVCINIYLKGRNNQRHSKWWCFVHKQPRVWELPGPDVSRWTRDQRHDREQHFCFIPGFTSVDREGRSTSHFHLWQTWRFQFPHHKFSVPE